MNYSQIINYIASVSDTKDTQINELNNLNSALKKYYSDFELSIYNRELINKLKIKINESEQNLNVALNLGTPTLDFEFYFDNQRLKRNLYKVVQMWKLSIIYFEEIAKQPQQKELVLRYEELPDIITIEELSQLTGWTKSTINTKHSKGELAGVIGTTFTPKQGLIEYFQKLTKGLVENPEVWFGEKIQKQKQKKRV